MAHWESLLAQTCESCVKSRQAPFSIHEPPHQGSCLLTHLSPPPCAGACSLLQRTSFPFLI